MLALPPWHGIGAPPSGPSLSLPARLSSQRMSHGARGTERPRRQSISALRSLITEGDSAGCSAWFKTERESHRRTQRDKAPFDLRALRGDRHSPCRLLDSTISLSGRACVRQKAPFPLPSPRQSAPRQWMWAGLGGHQKTPRHPWVVGFLSRLFSLPFAIAALPLWTSHRERANGGHAHRCSFFLLRPSTKERKECLGAEERESTLLSSPLTLLFR